MATVTMPRAWALAAGMLALTVLPAFAESTCCPSDGNGKPLVANTGLGSSAPPAKDQSLDANWQVYVFEFDGVRYLQVNDRNGAVHAVAGHISDTAWVLPIGSDAKRVSTPQEPRPAPAGATRSVVYRSPDVVVAAYTGAEGVTWSVESTEP